MIGRRAMLGGTTLGSMLTAWLPADAAAAHAVAGDAAAQQLSDRSVEDVAAAIDRLRIDVQKPQTFWEIEPVRVQQKAFLRTASKLPDFVDVGTDIWLQVYDWHVRYNQPMSIGRDPLGRLTILLMSTTLIMRPDLAANYVGPGYDNR